MYVLEVLKSQRALHESAGSMFTRTWGSQTFLVVLTDVLCYIYTPTPGEGARVQGKVHFHQQGSSALETPNHPVKLAAIELQTFVRVAVHETPRRGAAYRTCSMKMLLEQLVAFVCRDRPALLQGRTPVDILFVVNVYYNI